MFCYYRDDTNEDKDKQHCKVSATEELEFWCSEGHKKLWQDKNYTGIVVKENGKRKLTILEMQEALRTMKGNV